MTQNKKKLFVIIIVAVVVVAIVLSSILILTSPKKERQVTTTEKELSAKDSSDNKSGNNKSEKGKATIKSGSKDGSGVEPIGSSDEPLGQSSEPVVFKPSSNTPSLSEIEPGKMDYATYLAMSSEDQYAYFETFKDAEEFLKWYNTSKAAYEKENDVYVLNPGDVIDLGGK